MRYHEVKRVVVLAVLFALVATGCDFGAGKKKELCDGGHAVGESWTAEDGCNTCTCEEGLKIACTEMACVATCEDGHEVGESWTAPDGCNTCSCGENLTVACTQMACVATCEDGHEVGESWTADDGCNTCTCTEGLVVACSEMDCLTTCEDGHEVGESWAADDGCNTCSCTEDLLIACTEMACVTTCEDGHEVGESWAADDGCNTCSCTEDLLIACTEMACIATCEDGHEVGESWAADDGCNTCTCSDDLVIVCTKKLCPPQCDDGHFVGETWDAGDGCNVCACDESLQILCTAAICPVDCEEIEAAYGALLAANTECVSHDDCQVLAGQCGLGLGGCWEVVNQGVTQEELGALGLQFAEAGCLGPVCKCAPPPTAGCYAGKCVVTPPEGKHWTELSATFLKTGGFMYTYMFYQLAGDVAVYFKGPEQPPCGTAFVEPAQLNALLAAADLVDWPGVKASYKSKENPYCCCDQFQYYLAVTLSATDGTSLTLETEWCDESLMAGGVPEQLLDFTAQLVTACQPAQEACK